MKENGFSARSIEKPFADSMVNTIQRYYFETIREILNLLLTIGKQLQMSRFFVSTDLG
jgi:hypothetical protein